MTSTPHVSVREWTDVVRRARLGKTTKYVALVLATYADFTDGTRIYPGLATLAYAAEVDHKTAKKAVAELLRFGLIEIVKAHSGTRGRGTEYRLVLGEDLFEHVDVPSPDRARTEADRIGRAQRRNGSTGSPGPRTPGGQPVDNSEVQGLPAPVLDTTPAAGPEEVRGTPDPVPAEVRGISRPQYGVSDAPRTSRDQPTTTTSHETADLRTAAPGPREDAAEDPISDEGFRTRAIRERAERSASLSLIEGNPDAPRSDLVSLWPAAVPDEPRSTPAAGHGFCLDCHAAGKTVLAADPANGSACAYHLRARESA